MAGPGGGLKTAAKWSMLWSMDANPTEQRLSECGIRPTAQRVQIALLLLAAPQHLSAEQILASLIICLVGSCVIAAGYFMRRAERQRLLDVQIAERG